ncbi:hypothetical protein QH494_11310 [Sphingomonas sp. AR_OL41]|uniref:hypothetical protein n=1 Tax=Sphingomonas sp. AR_OL41 TaxID=3042729 RepID=UPI0024801483|nr:hypothetical protein [Sphingomonas sp. AR_OL41]MDH7972768.1 hypothetical protein [Sphingomonas sp. AR_OL41]MDH7972774.1 hypothetical protein [Sphingomonas sp. AR_OL41]
MATSISIRAETLDQYFKRMGANEYSQRLAVQVAKLSTLTLDLNEVFNNPNPTQPEAAHIVRIAKASNRLALEADKIKSQIDAIASEGLAAINKLKLAKVPLVPGEYQAEIRERARSMSPADLNQMMLSLAAENKAVELAAITQVPAILTGISESDQAKYRELIFKTHAGDALAEEAALLDDYDGALGAYQVAKATAGDYANDRTIAGILNAEQRAVNADARLAHSIDATA